MFGKPALSVLIVMLISLPACQDTSGTRQDIKSLKASLATFDVQEKEITATRKKIRKELQAVSLKDPARIDVVERGLQCKKTLEKLQFTRRQYKRRLKAAKSGVPNQVMEIAPVFHCD